MMCFTFFASCCRYASTLFMSSEQQQVHHESSTRSHKSAGGSDRKGAGVDSSALISTSMKNLRKQVGSLNRTKP